MVANEVQQLNNKKSQLSVITIDNDTVAVTDSSKYVNNNYDDYLFNENIQLNSEISSFASIKDQESEQEEEEQGEE